MGKTIKNIGNICFVFLAIIGLLLIIGYGYYHYFVKDITVGVNNISDQLGLDIVADKDLSDEEKDIYAERWFLEANYYSNHKKNGIELQELNFNYFTNYRLESIDYRSTGMQYVGDYKHHVVNVSGQNDANNYVFPDFYYYDTTDGISYEGHSGHNAGTSTMLKRSTSFTIKIDNRPFEIKLDKYVKKGWWIFGSTYYYTYSELFEAVFNSIKSNSARYGDYYIRVNLSDYFSIFEYDTDSGKFKADDVADIIKNYSVLKFHYDENGARNSTQSLFGVINCDPKYDADDKNVDTDYWQERVVYNLRENSKINSKEVFNFRYSDIYDGYFISLSVNARELFLSMPRTKVNLYLDLQSDYLKEKNYKIVGIDYNGFEDFEIDTLAIVGEEQTFTFLDKSLYNSRLQTLKHSKDINFDFASTALNNEFSEVIV